MNRGVLIKTMREVRWAMCLFALAVFLLQVLLGYVIPRFSQQLSTAWLELPFVRDMIKGLLGIDISSGIASNAMQAVAWVHPIMLATLWAAEISFCTRMPAGEVDRGTIDVLLGLPVSRTRLYVSETLVWLVGGAILCVVALSGNLLGTTLSDTTASSLGRVAVVSNLYCLYLAVGGLALLVSSLSDRRGRAVGVVVAILLMSFLLNFVAQLWEPASRLAFLGVLHYYRPVALINGTAWPVSDMVVLATIGGAFWLLGLVVFNRRDICTV